jgi:hypothetical protein
MSNEAAKLLKGIGGWILSSIDVRGPEVALRNRLGKNSLISGIDRYQCQNRQVSIDTIDSSIDSPNPIPPFDYN